MQKTDASKIDHMHSCRKIPIRISFIGNDGFPNIISLWYEEINSKIFCATQKSAKVISYIQKNPICGFEIAADNPPYKGVRGTGTARVLENKGQHILHILMKKYLGEKESTLSKFLKEHSSNEVAIEITPHKISNYDYSKRMRDVW